MTDLPRNLGELRASGYQSRSVKDEMRANLLMRLAEGSPLFPGILGYDETVIPQVQNAVLSRHDMLFLGLRGQGKTRQERIDRLEKDLAAASQRERDAKDQLQKVSMFGWESLGDKFGAPGRSPSLIHHGG